MYCRNSALAELQFNNKHKQHLIKLRFISSHCSSTFYIINSVNSVHCMWKNLIKKFSVITENKGKFLNSFLGLGLGFG